MLEPEDAGDRQARAPGLDDTITDPLKEVERAALTKIRKHEAAVSALRNDVADLRARAAAEQGSTGIAELRHLCDEAAGLEALLGLPRELLEREALREAEWPAEDLAAARKALEAVDACETATRCATAQISEDGTCTPAGLQDALQGLVRSWWELRAAERAAREGGAPAVRRVDLQVEARAGTIRPLCDALLDRSVEVHGARTREAGADLDGSGLERAGALGQLHAFLQQDWAQQALSALRVDVPGGELLGREQPAEEEDPLLRTVPCARVPQGPALASSAAVLAGSAELWHAVHVGDQRAVESLRGRELCNARMRDASGHTVLWHAIAFNHVGIANLMLETFPPGTEQGVDVTEIHPRKGDTLLHLLCQSKTFGTQLAHLFKRIAAASPPSLFQKVNHLGLTFFQIAASSLNFWVLTFVLRNFQQQAKALVCMPNNAPLKNMAEVIPHPLPPAFRPPEPFPEHFRVADMLQQDDSGAVPYADVAFDVGPSDSRVAAGRFLAHRIVVATQSPVLFEALERLPLTELSPGGPRAAVFRVDPRISQEVWRSALQFMYTGVISCGFAGDVAKVIELLRACTLYKLPRPLLEFAQAGLYPLLPGAPPHFALQALSACGAGPDPELRPAREASTYIVLRSAHRLFEQMDPKEAAQVLERVVQTVEHAVFHPRERGPQAGPQPDQPDGLSQSLRGLPRDAPLQSLWGAQDWHHATPDPMSQSLRAARLHEGLGLRSQGQAAPGAQAYGRVPGGGAWW